LLVMQPIIFDFLQKPSEICVWFQICLIACLRVGINISEELYHWQFLVYTRFLCFVINKFSSCLGRNIFKDLIFEFSWLWHLTVAWILTFVVNPQTYYTKVFYLLSYLL
jgi:hypothetical protein